eukprot:CAMPEP_0198115002 /NCGR_PEP_ID=MMETSP1442-20131203/6222_1 /TAXON_ID= /ORGANISM="Craspedostauros australis, Strain CCMP3328" /LENGTH=41 /DNA_ID= /DNA_START= /DNA_END= /DNA_ORIENTATION=
MNLGENGRRSERKGEEETGQANHSDRHRASNMPAPSPYHKD